MKVFLDTSMFIAFFLKQEAHHNEVVEKYTFYKNQNPTFITSNYVLDELYTWFNAKQNKSFLGKLIQFMERIEKDGEIKVFYVDNVIDEKARKVLLKFSDHKISFTDATTYVLYKEFSLDEIFTLDSDFKKMRVNTAF